MPQISIDAFDGVRIILVADIAHVTTGVGHVNIAQIPVSTIISSLWRGVNQSLDSLRRLVKRRIYPDNLPWQAADHGDNVRIFAGFAASLSLDKVIQLINFKRMFFLG